MPSDKEPKPDEKPIVDEAPVPEEKPKPKKRGPKPKIDEYYVNPAVFKDQIREYYKTDDCIFDLANSLKKIAYGLGNKSNFINYTYRDDMISDGIENCLQYMNNFNPKKSNNPFAYFTQIIYYAFIRRIQKEKKQQDVKAKVIANSGVEMMMDSLEGDDAVYKSQMLDFLQKNIKESEKKK